MKVGINAYFLRYPLTGTGTYLRELVAAMGQAEPECRLRLYVPRGVVDPAFVARGYDLKMVPVPAGAASHWGKLFFEQLLFPRAALEDGCEVIHAPYLAPPVLGARIAVTTIHDLIPLVLPQYRRGPLAGAYALLTSVTARRSARILCDSAWTKRDVVQRLGVPAGRVRVVHLAAGSQCTAAVSAENRTVDFPRDGELARVRRRYELPEPYILYYGGFDRRKAVDVLLRAYARLRCEQPQAPALVLAGRLPRRASAALFDPRPMVEALGQGDQVRMTGAFDEAEKAALLAGARLFVFPSIYEGFGLDPLEAMARGVPVVSTRATSIPEVCEGAAVLVRPGDERDLAAGMSLVLGDDRLRGQLRDKGLARAAQFSWRTTAQATAAVYREVAAAKHRTPRVEAAPASTLGALGGEERCSPSFLCFNPHLARRPGATRTRVSRPTVSIVAGPTEVFLDVNPTPVIR